MPQSAGTTATTSTAVSPEPAAPRPGWRSALIRVQQVPVRLALAGLLGLAALLWLVLQFVDPYLGHDESVYASEGRSWAIGWPADNWQTYRPVGLPILASAVLRLSHGLIGDTWAVRLIGLVLALLLLLVVYRVATLLGKPRRALLAVLLVLGGVTYLRRLPEFLDDIPAAGLLLVACYLVIRSRTRLAGGRQLRRALPAAAAVAVLACVIRYGATSGVLAIALTALIVWGPRAWLRAWRECLGAALIFAVALAVLAVAGVAATGKPFGIMTEANQVAHRAYWGQGLVFYAQAFPLHLAGPFGALVILAGALGAVLAGRRLVRARRGGPVASDLDRARAFLGLAAAVQVLLLGLIAHGEPRFVFFPMFALTILGVDAIALLAGDRARTVLTWTAGLGLVAVAGSFAAVVHVLLPTTQARTESVHSLQAVSVHQPCLVVADLAPESGWATGCASSDGSPLPPLPASTGVYVVVLPGTPGQPSVASVRHAYPGRQWTVREVQVDGKPVQVTYSPGTP